MVFTRLKAIKLKQHLQYALNVEQEKNMLTSPVRAVPATLGCTKRKAHTARPSANIALKDINIKYPTLSASPAVQGFTNIKM
jgi:hypothetical protein